ncbi:MAG: polysaccharide biosynthesis tyrosine autokinase [Actinomycetota bacterium]
MQEPTRRPPASSDLRELVGVLRKHRPSILLITGVTVIAALFLSFRQTPIYDSTAQVLVKPTNANQVLAGVPAASLISMDTERGIAESSAVANIAAGELGSIDAAQLQEATDVTVPTNTQFLDITFSDPDPAQAQAGAQAIAVSYLGYREEQAIEDAATAAQGYQQRIKEQEIELAGERKRLRQAKENSPEAFEIQADIDQIDRELDILRAQLTPLLAQGVDAGDIIAAAQLATSPSSPNHMRNGLLALIVGLALGVGFAFLRERLDDRLAGREDFEELTGSPVLGVVPSVPGWKKKDEPNVPALSQPKGGPAEAYRTIRTNLQFMARSGEFKTVMITSASLGEGKTTTSANLAVTLAQTGKRVIVVGADLRKPRIHRFFRMPNDVGVTSVLSGQTRIGEAARRVGGLDTLRVIPSGPVPQNPAELLGSEAMDRLLHDLRDNADFVILDTAPVLAVSDALILARRSDGIVIVADAATTSRSAVAHVRDQLEQVGANIVGGVFNNFDPSTAKYYPSYYRYYYSYQYRPENEPQPTTSGNGRTAGQPDPSEMWR